MKIISLESTTLSDWDQENGGSISYVIKRIEVGRPYGGMWWDMFAHTDIHNETDVVSIDLETEASTGVSRPWYGIGNSVFVVKLKNGHILILPANQYITEYAPDNED